MTYRLPPANWENPSDADFGVGETILEAISDGRIFDIEPYGVGFKLTERCDEYFSLFLTAPQLYQLGTEVRELAEIQLASEETRAMTNLSPAAQAVMDAYCKAPVDNKLSVAAALRAVAEQVGPSESLPPGYAYSAPAEMWHYEFKLKAQRQILAIADELEANSQFGES